jgi:hypothetical protein
MHTFTIPTLILNMLNTTIHKKSYSWLLHITKIYTLEYIVKNSKNKIKIHFKFRKGVEFFKRYKIETK